MDKIAAVRAGLIHVEHEQAPDHRVPCSLCGMPCEPDKLTAAFGDQDLCPECFAILDRSRRRYRARMRREEQEHRLLEMGVTLNEERR